MARVSAVPVAAVALMFSVVVTASESKHEAPPAHEASKESHDSKETHEAEQMAELAEHAARTSSRDVKVPTALVAKVEKDYDAYLTKEGVINKGSIRRALLNVRADLQQKRRAALHEDARVVTPLGGGVVELSDLITPVRGAFAMKIVATRESGGEPENMKVFFVSRSKNRSINGEQFGAGCNKWMDITGFFKKAMAREGFQLYTADQRYLSVIGGTFVIVGYSKEAIEVGSITFTDSRYSEVLCPSDKNGPDVKKSALKHEESH